MNIKFMLYLSFLPIFFGISISKKTPSSYLEESKRKNIDIHRVFQELETFYLNNFPIDMNYDPVCALDDNKKRALCDLVFSLKHYSESLDVSLNKIAAYFEKLTCEEKELSFDYFRIPFNKGKVIQKMYHCPGRHKIVRTSFIEDDHYNSYYLSFSPKENSIMVYMYINASNIDEYNIFDRIINVDLSKLKNLSVTIKDVVNELKLNNNIHTSFDYKDIEFIYKLNYNKLGNDPICSLEYEKKISLCNIIFTELAEKQMFDITINEAGVYLFNMNCITKSIYSFSSELKELLSEKENIYPCFGRHQISETENYLTDDYIKKFYVSNGPRRNSVFIYVLSFTEDLSDKIFTLIGMMDNIDIRSLESTVILLHDIKLKSQATYIDTLNIVNTTELNYEADILSYIHDNKLNSVSKENEAKFLDRLMLQFENDRYKLFMKMNITEKKKGLAEDKIQNQDTLDRSMHNFLLVGPQIFKLLLEKKRGEIKFIKTTDVSNLTIERMKKKMEERKLKKDVEIVKKNQTLIMNVQKLIEKMELFIESKKL